MSGTIPTMVYYGIVMIMPNGFYPIAFLVCVGVSLSIGTSWTTAGTLGVGLVGLANMLGLSPEITAGAVISGAYVGDKVSPLSESTVLAAQLNGVELYKHLRTQMWTTLPAAVIALIAFIMLGINQHSAFDANVTNNEMKRFNDLFHITPWNLLPLFFLLTLSVVKVPASLAIMCSALLAGIMTPIMQPQVVLRFIAEPDTAAPLLGLLLKPCGQRWQQAFRRTQGLSRSMRYCHAVAWRVCC